MHVYVCVGKGMKEGHTCCVCRLFVIIYTERKKKSILCRTIYNILLLLLFFVLVPITRIDYYTTTARIFYINLFVIIIYTI